MERCSVLDTGGTEIKHSVMDEQANIYGSGSVHCTADWNTGTETDKNSLAAVFLLYLVHQHIFVLAHIQGIVHPFSPHQLCVLPLLHDPAVMHKQDDIRIHGRGEPVRDDE